MKAIKTKFVCVVAAFLSACSWASAQGVTLTSDVTSIVVGQSITFNVVVVPPQNDPNYHLLAFNIAEAFFNSGDGQQVTAVFGPFGGGNVTFTYLTPGDYAASAAGLVLYNAWVCGDPIPGVCGPFPMTAGSGVGSIGGFIAIENITVAAVPEPSTWAMMVLGFAGLGFAFRKSRRRNSVANFSRSF